MFSLSKFSFPTTVSVNPHISFDHARYQPALLGLAIICSFVSGTLAASDSYCVPVGIILLMYATFSLLFIPTMVVEWRLEKRIPPLVKYAYTGLATGTQLAAIIWWDIAYGRNWYMRYHSHAASTRTTSIISLVALVLYLVLPFVPDVWKIAIYILLPERLRKTIALDTTSEEPLLPAYSTNTPDNAEAGAEDTTAVKVPTAENRVDTEVDLEISRHKQLPKDDVERV
ncbi:hypothetical protein RSOLAG1IB_07742 [Rhizoctonia solani AG-1 IB]|uniref:Uncharacterized protein n=1 Tax=Thanatephorus cucumeris (strain AG1-IB / isolate 7/3/14) TaxID=1108050 RepID=A0A0B7FE85_THACB|nr:hypothetical protein RSOLAG1IB_07742 [Rhizoctonia solani AG-1 IB]